MSLETSLVASGKQVTWVPFQQDAAGSASNVPNLFPHRRLDISGWRNMLMGIAIWPEGNRQNNSTCGRLTGRLFASREHAPPMDPE